MHVCAFSQLLMEFLTYFNMDFLNYIWKYTPNDTKKQRVFMLGDSYMKLSLEGGLQKCIIWASN
jgi:hypothetical protein